MKTLTTFVLLMLLASTSKSQTPADEADLLEKIVWHSYLEKYYAPDEDGNNSQRLILQYPVYFSAETISALSSEIGIINDESDLPSDARMWFRFRTLEIGPNVATAIVNFFYFDPLGYEFKMLIINVEAIKNEGDWQVTTLNLGEL